MLVASASNDDVADQGAPAVELQPGDAPDINAGRGLVVTAAEFDDTRAGTGFGGQISLAAYGFFDDGTLGPPGLISTYPRNAHPARGRHPARRLRLPPRAVRRRPLRLPAGHVDGGAAGGRAGGADLQTSTRSSRCATSSR